MTPEEYSAEEFADLPRAKIMRALWLSIGAGAFGSAFFQLTIGVIFVGFALALGASNLQIGFLTSTLPLGGLAQLFASYLIQRTGRRRLLFMASYLISRSLWLLVILVPLLIPEEHADHRIPAVFAILLVSNLLHALGSNAWLSWMGDLIPGDIRARFFGTRQAITTATGMATGLLAGKYMDWWETGVVKGSREHFLGFATLFGAAVALGVLDILIYRFIPHPRVHRDADPPVFRETLGKVLKNRNFRRLVLLFAWWYVATGIAIPFFNVYFREDLHLKYTTITWFGIASGVVFIGMSYLWGRVVHLVGSKSILGVSFLLAGLGPMMYIFTTPERIWPVLLAFVIGSMGWAATFMLSMNLTIALSPRVERPVYLAWFFAVTGTVTACSYALGGQIAEWLTPVSFSLFGFRVAHLQVLFVLTGILRASCVIPLLGIVDVERPPKGYMVLRALETRMPFRVFLDAYRLLQTRVRQRNRNAGPADSTDKNGKARTRGPTPPENRDT